MKYEVLRENLALLHALVEAAENVRYGIDDVPDSISVKAEMFYTQTVNFVDELTKNIIYPTQH